MDKPRGGKPVGSGRVTTQKERTRFSPLWSRGSRIRWGTRSFCISSCTVRRLEPELLQGADGRFRASMKDEDSAGPLPRDAGALTVVHQHAARPGVEMLVARQARYHGHAPAHHAGDPAPLLFGRPGTARRSEARPAGKERVGKGRS